MFKRVREEALDLNNFLSAAPAIATAFLCGSLFLSKVSSTRNLESIGVYPTETVQRPIVPLPNQESGNATLVVLESGYETSPDGLVVDCFTNYTNLGISVIDLSKKENERISYRARVANINNNGLPDLQLETFAFNGFKMPGGYSLTTYFDIPLRSR